MLVRNLIKQSSVQPWFSLLPVLSSCSSATLGLHFDLPLPVQFSKPASTSTKDQGWFPNVLLSCGVATIAMLLAPSEAQAQWKNQSPHPTPKPSRLQATPSTIVTAGLAATTTPINSLGSLAAIPYVPFPAIPLVAFPFAASTTTSVMSLPLAAVPDVIEPKVGTGFRGKLKKKRKYNRGPGGKIAANLKTTSDSRDSEASLKPKYQEYCYKETRRTAEQLTLSTVHQVFANKVHSDTRMRVSKKVKTEYFSGIEALNSEEGCINVHTVYNETHLGSRVGQVGNKFVLGRYDGEPIADSDCWDLVEKLKGGDKDYGYHKPSEKCAVGTNCRADGVLYGCSNYQNNTDPIEKSPYFLILELKRKGMDINEKNIKTLRLTTQAPYFYENTLNGTSGKGGKEGKIFKPEVLEIFNDPTMVKLCADADATFKAVYRPLYNHIANTVPPGFSVMNNALFTQFGLTGGRTAQGNCEDHKDQYSLVNLIYIVMEDGVKGGNTRFYHVDDESQAYEIDSKHLYKMLGPFNRVRHSGTPWVDGIRGCIGFYVHRDIISFFHQFEQLKINGTCTYVERDVASMRLKREEFRVAYRCTGEVINDNAYTKCLDDVTVEELKLFDDIVEHSTDHKLIKYKNRPSKR